MPNTSHPARLVRQLTASTVSVLRPPDPSLDPAAARLHRIRRAVVAVGSCATLVQIVVWLLVAVLGPGLDVPWWLWTLLPTAVATFVLSAAIGLPASWYETRLDPR